MRMRVAQVVAFWVVLASLAMLGLYVLFMATIAKAAAFAVALAKRLG